MKITMGKGAKNQEGFLMFLNNEVDVVNMKEKMRDTVV
jgi:hypothetical protein